MKTASFYLRVREIAEQKGKSLEQLIDQTALPPEVIHEMWFEPQRNQEIAHLVVIAHALQSTLDNLVEIVCEPASPASGQRTCRLDKRRADE